MFKYQSVATAFRVTSAGCPFTLASKEACKKVNLPSLSRLPCFNHFSSSSAVFRDAKRVSLSRLGQLRNCAGIRSVINLQVRAMATQPKFPPQSQPEQPGAEHEMRPKPSVARLQYRPADKLKGKVALITGGDSGIGRAVAHHYAMEGASVAITYLSDKERKDAEETVHMVKEVLGTENKEPVAIQGDLGSDGHCKKVIDDVVSHFGTLDILVNNAAEQHYHGSIEEVPSEEWERTFRTNIHAYFYLAKYALPHMKEGSSIINTTSVNAYKGNPGLLGYSTTKGAIVAFTRSLALSVVGKGIRVNGVAPGPVWTPLIPATTPEEKVARFGSQCPMDRAAQPEEIAPSYVFLASMDASFYTGQVLHPNGGVIVNA